MGTGWTQKGQRCARCNGTPHRMVNCGCTGQPGTAQAGGVGTGLDAAVAADAGNVSAEVAATRQEMFDAGTTNPSSPNFDFVVALGPEEQELCEEYERELQVFMSSPDHSAEGDAAALKMGEIEYQLLEAADVDDDLTAYRWCEGRRETMRHDTIPGVKEQYQRDNRTLERVAPPPDTMAEYRKIDAAAQSFLADLENNPRLVNLAAVDQSQMWDVATAAAGRYGYTTPPDAMKFALQATAAWQNKYGPSGDDEREQLRTRLRAAINGKAGS